MKVLLLCGSMKPGPGSTARSAAREMLREVGAGVRAAGPATEFLDLRELRLPWWDGRVGEEYGSADLDRCARAIADADAVVLSAPAYWDALTGVVKNLFDLLGPAHWRGKLVAGLVIGMNQSSAWHGEDQLRQVLAAVGAWTLPEAFVLGDPRSHPDTAALVKELRRFGAFVGLTVQRSPLVAPAPGSAAGAVPEPAPVG
jgi:NAD(P)H-dependent FMN reductase